MQWRLLKTRDIYNYFRHIKCFFGIYKKLYELYRERERVSESYRAISS